MANPPNPARRSERARVAVLDAALSLSQEVGFPQVTIEAIAERAGVSKKTIYRWWPSKGTVVFEAAVDAAETLIAHGDTGDLAHDMREQLAGVAAMFKPQETSVIAALIGEASRDPVLAGAIREEIDARIEAFNERMRSAQRAGEIPADADLEVALDLFYGPIYHRLAFHLPMPDDDEISTRVDHVLVALRRIGDPWR
ncbi:AcrR family transcriptional regulator [Agromyces sp. 3263]|uniref:TetR/AcrR family transcriptional regulator n=1 Tax=Agromyces sp. 3263 TaxID=2817750 RepID=UPI002855CE6D|nr:TetR/AcrR family transcriptional regulator [Agromyces sp. 3263]MDR6905177.1 AcrR family transcriptional regulator [Agromyces sp. 3263]